MLSPAGMFEHFADLALAHAACMSHRAFGLSAVVDQLHVESAHRLGGTKHLGLQMACRIPRRLPAFGGVESEDQP